MDLKLEKYLGLDCDGVLLNFVDHFFEYTKIPKIVPRRWHEPAITENFYLIQDDENFWRHIPYLEHPSVIDFNFKCYITACPCKPHTRISNLIDEGFPVKPVLKVGLRESKLSTIQSQGLKYFVDDKPDTFYELNENGIICLLRDSTSNQMVNTIINDVDHRIKSLSEVVAKIQEIELKNN